MPVQVYVVGAGPAGAAILDALHDRADVTITSSAAAAGVVIAAAGSVEEAAAAYRRLFPSGRPGLVVVADRLSFAEVARSGGLVLLPRQELTPDRLAGAVRAAAAGYDSVPRDLADRLGRSEQPPDPGPVGLSARQHRVLLLVAEGLGNADIAERLGCSEHTVKNAVYDLMAHLHARTRAQAVAHAVRDGLL